MTELSPAANAIVEAWREAASPWEPRIEQRLAAALTALAVRIKGADGIRQDVLDIINELEQFNA
jgi:hypothetical protein